MSTPLDQQRFSLTHAVIRPTLPKDTTGALRLCSQIWDGDDYIPYVWNDWMQEHSARMWTAELGGEVAGFVRLDCQSPDCCLDFGRSGKDGRAYSFQGRSVRPHAMMLSCWIADVWQQKSMLITWDGIFHWYPFLKNEPRHAVSQYWRVRN